MFIDYDATPRRRRAPERSTSVPSIRPATLADLPYVLNLQKRYTNEVGFLPTAAISAWIERGGVQLVLENNDPAGYVIARPRLNTARWCRPLSQVAVAMDAQRRHLGLALVRHVEQLAYGDLLEATQCWVADDIEAGDFFRAAGFVPIATRTPQNRRQRSLTLMRHALQSSTPADFFTIPPIAGCRPRRILNDPRRPILNAVPHVRAGRS
jgi:N-acetylglutamate synthase-like GNAT family acetyltransferase